jgi:hypothetical protein
MGIVACFSSIPPQELQRLQENPDEIEEFLYPDDGDSEPPNYLDLDKAWHGLHYLLTGESEGGPLPLAQAIIGGIEFGPEVGYGPARFLTADEVSAVAQALAPLTPDALTQRFNPKDMEDKQIYPEIIWVRDGDEALEYVLQSFPGLQKFYADAAARGDAVIAWFS